MSPFTAALYHLGSCDLRLVQSTADASVLSALLAGMDPWRTLHYSSNALQHYLLRQDQTLYRYTVVLQDKPIGVVCVRYPWLRGTCLELIGLDRAYQGIGLGAALLSWIEEQTRAGAANVWVLVSAFNTQARAFYERHGFTEIGPLKDFVQPGYDEIFLRKVLS